MLQHVTVIIYNFKLTIVTRTKWKDTIMIK